jgi:hypothetical protein
MTIKMLKFLAPYITVATVLTVLAGVLYGASVINATGVYGIECVAFLILAPGYGRWDERKHPPR